MREFYSASEIAKAFKKAKVTIIRRANKQNWPHREEKTRGGTRKLYGPVWELPEDVQVALVKAAVAVGTPPLPKQIKKLCSLAKAEVVLPEKASGEQRVASGEWVVANGEQQVAKKNGNGRRPVPHGLTPPAEACSAKVLSDPQVIDKIRVVQEALACPPDWKRRAWVEAVAQKHGIAYQTLYKWIRKFQEQGPEGLTNKKRRGPVCWDDEAVSFWVGLCLKRAYRKTSLAALYRILCAEAEKQGWRVGSYHSARWHFERALKKYGREVLLAYRNGGLRALDNALPPVLRSYNDLDPFEILVGDQHRFDFWVVDDETGRVFRPEGYLWQDLRTRVIFGGTITGEHYDTQAMLLALGIGCRVFGLPKAIYTDHGKPEESRTMSAVIRELSALAIAVEQTMDLPVADKESPLVLDPRTHRKAIVRNAKAKMIERTFQEVERILRDVMLVPGYVKRLNTSAEEQEIDQKEAEELAVRGKLLTFFEFCAAFYKALDYYNRKKPHRGVFREWPFLPKPTETEATPLAYLSACMAQEGFRPRYADEAILATIFLYRERRPRKVDRGMIRFRNEFYTHEELIRISGEWVEVRYDPYDTSYILVFHEGEFVCRAEAVEYSSMKDAELASRKIAEKRARRRRFVEIYRELTKGIPDMRNFSEVPKEDRPQAVFGGRKREEMPAISEEEFQRRLAELSAEPAKPRPQIDEEAFQREVEARLREQREAEKRPVFIYENDRYMWLLEQLNKGEKITAEDVRFLERYESEMDAAEESFWEDYCRTVFGRERQEIRARAGTPPARRDGGLTDERCIRDDQQF